MLSDKIKKATCMSYRKIGISEITLGDPLPYDVFDSLGNLLLHKGYVVTDLRQTEVLMKRGLYADSSRPDRVHALSSMQTSPKRLSVLQMINMANDRLQRILLNLPSQINAESKILDIAKTVISAVERNSDIALACLMLNQSSEMYAVRHCTDTAIVSILVAQTMEKPIEEVMSIAAAALTMNIGMLNYQDKLQHKEVALTMKERMLLRQHPQTGVDALQRAGIRDANWLSYVKHHHENEDGSGYPDGLSGKDIPQNAKIISLADRYCARVSARSYRKSLLPNTALRDIFIDQSKSIDSMLAAYFIKELGLYPPGTLVRLQNMEIGVVTQKGDTPTTPAVHIIVGAGGELPKKEIMRDTGKDIYAIREVLHEKKLTMRIEMSKLWGAEANS